MTSSADGDHGFGDGLLGDGLVMGWRNIERLTSGCVTIACHSVTHPNFRRLAVELLWFELTQSPRRIRDGLGSEAMSFAITFGRSAHWPPKALALAREAGHQSVLVQYGARRPGTVGRVFSTRYDDDRVCAGALRGATPVLSQIHRGLLRGSKCPLLMGTAVDCAALQLRVSSDVARDAALLALAGTCTSLVYSYVRLGLISERVTVFLGTVLGTMSVATPTGDGA